jgi:hypothetical protein
MGLLSRSAKTEMPEGGKTAAPEQLVQLRLDLHWDENVTNAVTPILQRSLEAGPHLFPRSSVVLY